LKWCASGLWKGAGYERGRGESHRKIALRYGGELRGASKRRQTRRRGRRNTRL